MNITDLKTGADKKIRTSDLRITNAPLYQLSYAGPETRQVYSKGKVSTTALISVIAVDLSLHETHQNLTQHDLVLR